MRKIIVEKNDTGQRLDKFLTKTFKNLPPSHIYKYIRKKAIKLDGRRCQPESRLQFGDSLELYINDEFLATREDDQYDFLKVPAELDIVFEDENLIIINKKPGVLAHPDENYHFDSAITRIQHYLYKKNEYNPAAENSFAPALVHRLDRGTGGLLMAAKTAEALRVLNEKMKLREVKKFYLCVAHGQLPAQEGTLRAYLEKNERKNQVYIFDRPNERTKPIATWFRVKEKGKKTSLLQVELLTGRTHQIRAHLAHIGHPLVGDSKYGTQISGGPKRQALLAYKVRFEFKGGAGPLEKLNGREFSVPTEKFIRENFDGAANWP